MDTKDLAPLGVQLVGIAVVALNKKLGLDLDQNHVWSVVCLVAAGLGHHLGGKFAAAAK